MMFSQTNPVLMKHCWVKFEEPKRDGDVGSGLVTKHLGSLQRFFGFEICTYIYRIIYIYIYSRPYNSVEYRGIST